MSWSITIIGHPQNVATALTAQSEKLEGQSKVEFDSALPHMVALVQENFNPEGMTQPVIKLDASGHGYATNGEQKQRTFNATIESFYATLV
jgi:hypothetical protein